MIQLYSACWGYAVFPTSPTTSRTLKSMDPPASNALRQLSRDLATNGFQRDRFARKRPDSHNICSRTAIRVPAKGHYDSSAESARTQRVTTIHLIFRMTVDPCVVAAKSATLWRRLRGVQSSATLSGDTAPTASRLILAIASPPSTSSAAASPYAEISNGPDGR